MATRRARSTHGCSRLAYARGGNDVPLLLEVGEGPLPVRMGIRRLACQRVHLRRGHEGLAELVEYIRPLEERNRLSRRRLRLGTPANSGESLFKKRCRGGF